MEKTDIRYQTYLKILKEELVPAMGCTEPIALAYAAAEARRILGGLPESVKIEVSGSIIKNVKSVIVPNTNHMKGIPAAAAAGTFGVCALIYIVFRWLPPGLLGLGCILVGLPVSSWLLARRAE